MNTQRDNTEAYYSLHTANGGRTNVADPEPDQVGSEPFITNKLWIKTKNWEWNKTIWILTKQIRNKKFKKERKFTI